MRTRESSRVSTFSSWWPAASDGNRGRRRRVAGRPIAAGLSLVEVLIASFLLLVILLGVLPLFTRAMISNNSGRESTMVSTLAQSKADEYLQLPFEREELTLDSGTEKVVEEYFSVADQEWKPVTPAASGPALFTRTTTVRQYGITVDASGDTDLTDPLDASVAQSAVQLKEIEVTVTAARGGGPLGPPKTVTVRVWKAF